MRLISEGTTESWSIFEGDFPPSVMPTIEDAYMHYCEMETQGPVLGFCGERASTKIENHWYCQHHGDALEQAQERWSGVNWFPLTYKTVEEPWDERHDYSTLFDDEDEE